MTLVQAAVVGSVFLMNRRQSTELFPRKLRNLWSVWQLRGLILLSLTSQIVLVSLGNRRKYIAKTWVRAIVWIFYLLADSVATMAIGILSSDIGQVYWQDHRTSRSLEYELTAFWAPFLLVHMGGMDTITAYSLEDNELWLRHSFALVAQAVTTAYILLMSWSFSSRLSPLFIVVFFVGLITYCERVWALYSASEKRFRDTIIPEISESKIMEECKLKQLEGYHVTMHQVVEVDVPESESVPNSNEAIEILMAHGFLEIVKRLFADLILSFQDADGIRTIFRSSEMDDKKALKIIEIELGLMFDFLYTKATIVYSSSGLIRRVVGSFLILVVLVMLLLDKALVGKNSSKIDLTITLTLLVVALLLNLCALGELLLSDQTAHWLIRQKKITMLTTINRIRTIIPTNWGRKRRRWSETVQQFSLLTFCFATRTKPLFCPRFLKLLRLEEVAEIFWYKSSIPPAQLYRDGERNLPLFYNEIKSTWSWAEENGLATDLKSLFGRRGGLTLERCSGSDLKWSVEMEFEQSILVWHLATEICYSTRASTYGDNRVPLFQDRSICMSRYMLYLLVEHPNMLPIGTGQIKFRDLYSGLGDFIEAHMEKPLKDVDEKDASEKLMKKVQEGTKMLVGGANGSNFVIFHGCMLASKLRKYVEVEEWEILANVWMEMLGHAASQCKGRLHAQQLRRGGEYLTHLWLLLAHFGLTNHFQVSHSRAIAQAIIR